MDLASRMAMHTPWPWAWGTVQRRNAMVSRSRAKKRIRALQQQMRVSYTAALRAYQSHTDVSVALAEASTAVNGSTAWPVIFEDGTGALTAIQQTLQAHRDPHIRDFEEEHARRSETRGENLSTYRIRAADFGDLEQIHDLLDEAISWLKTLRLDQWQGDRERQRLHLETDIAAETVFVVEQQAQVIATITLDEIADRDYWRDEDDVADALYVHRMAVRRPASGIGLGSAMLDWASSRVQQYRRKWLRLDTSSTNHRLHLYFKDLGFEHVRTEIVEHRRGGALFARPANYRHGDGPPLIGPAADAPTDR